MEKGVLQDRRCAAAFVFAGRAARCTNSLLGVQDNPQPIIKMIQEMEKTGLYPDIVFQYQLNEFGGYTLNRRYILTVSANLLKLKDYLLKKIQTEPDGYSHYREMSILQLAEAGALKIDEEGRIIEVTASMTQEKPVPLKEIADLKEKAQKDMPIAAEFLKNVIYTTYLIQVL